MRLKADCQLTTVINMNLNFLLKDDPSTFLSLPHLLWPHPLVQSMVGAVFIYLYISHIQWKTLPQVQRHKLSLMNIFIRYIPQLLDIKFGQIHTYSCAVWFDQCFFLFPYFGSGPIFPNVADNHLRAQMLLKLERKFEN